MTVHTFAIGEEVEWWSNFATKRGKIVATVLPGQRPQDLPDYAHRFKETGEARDHGSYIVEARHAHGAYTKKVRTYWPRVSSLKQAAPGGKHANQ